MRKWGWVVGPLVLTMLLGVCDRAFAEDVVYLKDGSIIHGTITEEVPGKSIKIETKDGNVFVYKMKAIEKITHTAPTAENSADTNSATEAAAPAKTTPAEVNDPNAKFSKFGLFVNAGFWAPDTFSDANSFLETAAGGDTSFDFVPGWVKGGVGFGWFTNNFGLKWDLELSYQPNDYTYSGYYWDGYQYVSYNGSVSTDILMFGTEFEGDIDLDMITNANNVTSFYIPLIVGFWEEDYTYDDGYTSDDYTGTTTSFGTGIGMRGFDSSNFLWDFQLVYRGCSRGNYLKDPSGYEIPLPNGKFMDANVSGLDLNFTIGIVM